MVRLFVGGLNYDTKEEDLIEHFTTEGIQVTRALIIRDKITNRSRGFGFVTVETNKTMDELKAMFDRVELMKFKLTVNEAEPRKDYEPKSQGREGYRGDRIRS